jgi:2-polyprenyl-3-methyl-5-hydroxy-6-metoxy-1,4-benzoquinol methylase
VLVKVRQIGLHLSNLAGLRVTWKGDAMRGFGIVKKEAFILREAANSRAILHIGCTNSPYTKMRLENGTLLHQNLARAKSDGASLVGIDTELDDVRFLKEYLPGLEIVHGDGCILHDYFGDRQFDLIIAGDVIEHISNPGSFMASCMRQLTTSGVIIVTTINAFGVARFLKALLFHEAVHPDHVAYYSTKTLQVLLRREKLLIRSYGYYQCEPLSGPFSLNRAVSNIIELGVTVVWPQYAEGVVVVAQREATASD